VGRALLLEPLGGIAGDMFMAAALDLGVSADDLRRALLGLALPGWRLQLSRAERHAISGTHVDVVVDAPAQGHPHRSLADIRRMIDACGSLGDAARRTAQAIFTVIGEAEAKIHAVPLESIHFHEVGAVDSIVDVCAAAWVREALGVTRVLSLPPPLGSGQVRTAHGQMPVPAPATLEILRDVPVKFEGLGELTTPTGAAILKVLAEVGPFPPCRVTKVGYGVGTKDFRDRPNVLRASLAELADGLPADEAVMVLEVNLDDASPQLLGALVEALLEAGALDAFVLPAVMKKGRPGHLLTALCAPGDRERLCALLLKESPTLGIRYHLAMRDVLERRFEEVQTPWGPVKVKLGLRAGEVWNAQPEFDDCRRVAKAAGVPIKDVHQAALAAFQRSSIRLSSALSLGNSNEP
jgi:uncharacterized protein (TIGR00299 family) protein